MQSYKASVLALVAAIISAAAQNTTASAPTGSQVQVQSNNQYSGASLVGYHVGAGLSYMVARTPGSGNSFTYNSSATSDQLLNNNIAVGIPLPCYIIKASQISDDSGPLECGAGDQPGYYDVARLAGSDDMAPKTITFDGIRAWYVCAVQSFTYGWVQATVVGSYASSEPSGPGVQNCTSINSLILVNNNTTSGSDGADDENEAASTTVVSSSAAATTTAKPSGPTSSKDCSACSGLTSIVTRPCSSSTAAPNTTLYAPSATLPTAVGPIATFTGAADSLEMSQVAILAIGAAMVLF